MHVSTQDIALFGKLPDHGDFVRHQATGPLIRAMDDWIRQGLYLAKQRRADGLDADPATRSATRFFFDPGSHDGGLLGALHPSHDRVGRTFPFLAAVEVQPTGRDEVPSLPIAYDALLTQTSRMVREAATAAISLDDAIRAPQPRSQPASGAQARYDRFLQATTLRSLLERLWDYADDSRTYRLVKNVLDILLPLRDGVPDRFSLVLRFPLSDTDERALEAAFWMQLTLRLIGPSDAAPSFFIVDGAEGGGLFLSLRPPPHDVLLHLFLDQADTDNVCRLEQMGSFTAVEAALAIPAKYGTMIESDTLTLQDMLNQL